MDVQRIFGQLNDYHIDIKAKFLIVMGVDDASMTEADWQNRIDQFAEVGFSGKLLNLVKRRHHESGGFRPSGEYAAALLFEAGNSSECSRIFQCAEPVVHRFANFGNEIACAWVKLLRNMNNPNSLTTSTQWARSPHLHRTAHRDRWVFLPCSKNGVDHIRWVIRTDQPGEPRNEHFECTVLTYGDTDPSMCTAPRADLSVLWR